SDPSKYWALNMMPALTPLILRLRLRPALQLLNDVLRVVPHHLVTALQREVAHELAHAPSLQLAHLLQHFGRLPHDAEALDDFGRDEAPLGRGQERIVALVHDLLAFRVGSRHVEFEILFEDRLQELGWVFAE